MHFSKYKIENNSFLEINSKYNYMKPENPGKQKIETKMIVYQRQIERIEKIINMAFSIMILIIKKS
jgi:hypothetical protein